MTMLGRAVSQLLLIATSRTASKQQSRWLLAVFGERSRDRDFLDKVNYALQRSLNVSPQDKFSMFWMWQAVADVC